jgi:imidazole glycerol-phosphate synthase subunit HisH
MSRTVTIIRTGIANTASLAASFARLGLSVNITEDQQEIEGAELLVLPGVGSFGAGAAKLDALGLREVLIDRIGGERPLLAVCLGMQLLAETSEETPGARGLGVIKARAARFPSGIRVPQMGWNDVEAVPNANLLRCGCAYFANSYRLIESPEGWTSATAEYGGRFIAAMERGATLACQFHPELSGPWGLELLARWAGVPVPTTQSSPVGAISQC